MKMKATITLTVLLLSFGMASARIPVTESATIMDANIDGSSLNGNYRASDDCNGRLFDPQSKGLVMLKQSTSFENETNGVKTKHAELSYTYFRRKSGSDKFAVKQGKITLNKLRKITEQKKLDNEVVESKSRLEAQSADVMGDLSDSDKDGSQAVRFLEDGRIILDGKDCDERVELVPTTDTVP